MRPALALLVAAVNLAPAAADEVAEGVAADRVGLPKTIEDVWYRTSGKRFHAGGDLTITPEGLEFITNKKTVSIPMDEIYLLSFGKLKGDVDTDWAVLGLGTSGPARIVGFRDGTKMGYGGRTEEIFESLRAAFEQLAVVQYRVPAGFRAYDKIARQCTLAIPAGWDPYLESVVVESDGRARGTIVFSSVPIERPTASPGTPPARVPRSPELERVLAGETPAFFLVRRELERGMDCDGFKAKVRARLVEREARAALAGKGWELTEAPAATPAPVGLCNGLRIQARARRPTGGPVRLDLYAAAHGDTLFLLGMRALEDKYEAFRPPFETALSTLKFSVAR